MKIIQQIIEGFEKSTGETVIYVTGHFKEYKVLTLWQPWASLLAHGVKRIETRPKPTNWTSEKGVYLIHAAQKWSKEQAEMCIQEPFKSVLQELGYLNEYEDKSTGYKGYSFSFAHGEIIGKVEVVECKRMVVGQREYGSSFNILENEENEKSFGDYREGRYAWLCKNPQLLKTPIPYKGGQGYYVPFKDDKSLIKFV